MTSGNSYCFKDQCGLYYIGAHNHDGIWHLAVASTSFGSWPFVHPTYAGEYLRNYNYLIDLVIYAITLLGFSANFVYFKILPAILILLGLKTLIMLSDEISKYLKYDAYRLQLLRIMLTIFVFFGSSFGFALTLKNAGTLKDATSILALQGPVAMTNIQFMYSLIIALYLFTWCVRLMNKKHMGRLATMLLPIAVYANIGLKLYSLPVTAICIGFITIKLFADKQYFRAAVVAALSLGSAFVGLYSFYDVFAPTNKNVGLTYAPFSLVYALIEDPLLFYNNYLALMRYTLQGQWGMRNIALHLGLAVLYAVAHIGTRLVGVLAYIVHAWRRVNLQLLTLVTATYMSGLVVSILFIQKGVWWNTIQFYYYSIYMAAIYAAITMTDVLHWAKQKGAWARVVVVASVCGVLAMTIIANYDIREFMTSAQALHVPRSELKALEYLKTQPKGVVLTFFLPDSNSKALNSGYDTAYVAAFSGMQQLGADETQVALLGVDGRDRLKIIEHSPCDAARYVDYVYLTGYKYLNKLASCPGFAREFVEIYSEDEVFIHKRKKGYPKSDLKNLHP